MSIKIFNQVKKDRGFKPSDLIIYVVVLILIGTSFWLSYALFPTNEMHGFEVLYKNVRVFLYDFERDEYKIEDSDCIQVLDSNDEELTVKFSVYDGDGYNLIYVKKTKRSVSVIEADCSTRKDCVFAAAITNCSQTIICTPHDLIILPIGDVNGEDIIL